jgi:hypothetical protein
MKLGNTDIASVKLGSSQVQAVYLGNNLVWQNAPVAIAATGVGTTSFTANWEAYSGAYLYLLDVSESSDFSTFVYQNQVIYAPTTSYVVIGLNSNTTYYYRVRASDFELEAQDFFDRVADAGGTLSATEKDAVNILVTDMKADGIWSAMKAIYPMVGGGNVDPLKAAAACSQNLKSSSFTGAFSAGWTFASTGVTPNGTSAFFNTTLAPNGNLSTSSTHISAYSRSSTANTNDCLMGCYRTSPNDGIRFLKFGSDYYCENYVSYIGNNFPFSTHNGLFITTRISSASYKVFRNSTNIFSKTQNSSTLPTETIWVGANNEGSGVQWSNRENAFASIGDGLTDTEASNYYIAVQGFNTTLDRYVGAPWYDNGELLLDAYPDSAAAYSLRKLRNNYIGGPIRVRRSSDNEEQDIYFDANGELDTTQLTTFCGAGDGFVETWYDQSGNALDATQVTSANQPQIVSSGSVIVQGNKPSVKFDGSNDVLNLSSTLPISAGDNLSIFQIEKKTSANSVGIWLTGASVGSPYAIVHFSNQNLIMNTQYNASSSNIAGGPLLGNNYNLISGFAKTLAANSEQYANGSLVSFTFTGTDSRQPSFTKIGQRAGSESSNTSFQEMIVYKSDQSTNRTGIETNINDFYSIY